jgi:hypothetical protein
MPGAIPKNRLPARRRETVRPEPVVPIILSLSKEGPFDRLRANGG